MAWLIRTISDDVKNLILKKQAEYKIDKNRCVSIEQTIDFLLKAAYLEPRKEVADKKDY